MTAAIVSVKACLAIIVPSDFPGAMF
jgi:hypothetical protein